VDIKPVSYLEKVLSSEDKEKRSKWKKEGIPFLKIFQF